MLNIFISCEWINISLIFLTLYLSTDKFKQAPSQAKKTSSVDDIKASLTTKIFFNHCSCSMEI